MAGDDDLVPPPFVPQEPVGPKPRRARFTRPLAGRLALAGLVADLVFGLLMAAVALLVSLVVPSCQGDSCMGGAQLVVGVVALPFVLFGALLLGLAVLRLHPVWGLGGLALPVALLVLGAFAATWLAAPSGIAGWGLLPLLALGAGPLATVTAGVVVLGRGWPRAAALPVVAVLLVGGVALNFTVLTPLRQARAITDAMPQPYRLTDAPGGPTGIRVLSLDLTPTTGVLQLESVPAGDAFEEISVSEGRPPTGAALEARCAPALSDIDSATRACVVVAAPAPNLALWRTGPDQGVGQVVVVREGAMIKIDLTQSVTDELALSLAARLEPVDARDLLKHAQYTYVA